MVLLLSALSLLAKEKPNIIFIIADDLGYSDLGCYGGEIQTPVLDSLAQEGLRYSQFYNTGRCWISRTALMTGFIRSNTLPEGLLLRIRVLFRII